MHDLRALYQEVVIDHGRRPRNFGELQPHSHHAHGYNPLCGDKLELFLQVDDGKITDAKFQGEGCAISMASASLFTEALKGKTAEEAEVLFRDFQDMTMNSDSPPDTDKMGKLAVLAGVREFPTRVKCATLAGHTVHAALNNADEPVKTE